MKNIFTCNPGRLFRIFPVCLILCTIFEFTSGQNRDSVDNSRTNHPNVVKLCLSSWAIYPNSLHLGYERVLDKSHSIYLFGGYNEFPKILHLNLSSTTISGARDKTGYSVGVEFRFYLPKENVSKAPHGIFLAPYVSYYTFGSTSTLTHTDSSGSQSASLNLHTSFYNIGFELGYQFIVAKRFVIDAEMFGPSFTYYNFQADLKGQINGDPGETLQAVIDALKEKFPLLNDLSNGKQVYSTGRATQKFPFAGFRYAVSIGFMF